MSLSAADFELLLQANRILSSKLNVGDVLTAVLELATKVVRAEASSLLLLDEKTKELYFDVTLGAVKDSVKQIRLKVGEGIAGWVAQERVPLIVNDVSRDPRFTQKVDKSTSFKTHSILAVPLLAKGRLIGVVEAINKELGKDFSESDREAFEIFASQSAIAIENARLFSDVVREKVKLNTVFGEMSEGVMLLDEAGRLLMLNQAAARFVGLSVEEAVGKTFGPDVFNGFESSLPFEQVLGAKEKNQALDLVRHEGKDFYLLALVHRLRSDPNSPEGYLVILRDTTEEKRDEMLKRNFLSLISHKLKTPLTVILGYAPILSSDVAGLSDFQKKAVSAIQDQGDQLSGLVEKLLHFSVVESARLARPSEATPLKTIVEEAVGPFQGMSDEKKSRITVGETGGLPSVFVDRLLMVEVVKNLIENALNFNDKKKKDVDIEFKKEEKAVLIRVKDNGTGIPSEEQEKIFNKFYQIENSFTGQVPGAGLGLAFCRKVVGEFGGAISVHSEIGKGSTFTVSLPIH